VSIAKFYKFINFITYRLTYRKIYETSHENLNLLAAKILGYHPLFIAFRHVLPNVLAPIIVYAMTDAVLVILLGASLGFLGLGAQPPTAEWGVMIANGQPYVIEAWWICLFPGLATFILGLGFSLLGDGLAKHLRITS
jgi:peptide/nickel transport system permease protein